MSFTFCILDANVAPDAVFSVLVSPSAVYMRCDAKLRVTANARPCLAPSPIMKPLISSCRKKTLMVWCKWSTVSFNQLSAPLCILSCLP